MAKKIAVGLTLLVLLGGCGYGVPIDNRTMVSALGIGFHHHDLRLTAEVVNPSTAAGNSNPVPGPPSIALQGHARSLEGALDQIQESSPGTVDLTDNQLLVFSQRLARRGIGPELAFADRPVNGRLTEWTAVADPSASALLSASLQSTVSSPFFDVYYAEMFVARHRPLIPATPLWMLMRDTADPGIDAYLPLLRIEHAAVRFAGAALFSGPRMTGTLSPVETAVLDAVDREVPGLHLSVPNSSGPRFGVEFTAMHTRIRVLSARRVNLTVIARGLITQDVTAVASPVGDRYHLDQATAERLDHLIGRVVETLQRSGCDALGVGLRIRAADPTAWHRLEQRWPATFSRMTFHVRTVVRLNTQGP